jgi:hypothetical protein
LDSPFIERGRNCLHGQEPGFRTSSSGSLPKQPNTHRGSERACVEASPEPASLLRGQSGNTDLGSELQAAASCRSHPTLTGDRAGSFASSRSSPTAALSPRSLVQSHPASPAPMASSRSDELRADQQARRCIYQVPQTPRTPRFESRSLVWRTPTLPRSPGRRRPRPPQSRLHHPDGWRRHQGRSNCRRNGRNRLPRDPGPRPLPRHSHESFASAR